MWYIITSIISAIFGAFLMGIIAGGKGVPISDHYDIVAAAEQKAYREGYDDGYQEAIDDEEDWR